MFSSSSASSSLYFQAPSSSFSFPSRSFRASNAISLHLHHRQSCRSSRVFFALLLPPPCVIAVVWNLLSHLPLSVVVCMLNKILYEYSTHSDVYAAYVCCLPACLPVCMCVCTSDHYLIIIYIHFNDKPLNLISLMIRFIDRIKLNQRVYLTKVICIMPNNIMCAYRFICCDFFSWIFSKCYPSDPFHRIPFYYCTDSVWPKYYF